MILAGFSNLVTVPFGYLLDWLYKLTDNYGWALIIFTILVKIILLPLTAKSKKSSMKMARITPRAQAIQKKYANDQQKQAEALRQLYKEEGVGMTGGCLWSFVPLLILFPLYNVVRNPAAYMPSIDPSATQGMNFLFFGIDLGSNPTFKIFGSNFSWPKFFAFLIPVLSAGSQLLSMFVSQKMNNSLVTDEKGLKDEETAKQSQANQTGKIMMWIMPLISLSIGFSFPAAISLYWLVQGIMGILIDCYLTVKYRKIYDAEDALRLQKAMEQEAIEEEKERLRAQRRAENPDGITENTSKKKLQQKQQKQAEAEKAAAKKEYAAKKGIAVENEKEAPSALSGIPERPFCKGRAYDPNRYTHTEE